MDLRKVNLYVLSGFYVIAGVNHFINQEFYYGLIPEFFGNKYFINLISGSAEIILGIGLISKRSRKLSSYIIVLMLLSFIPSHIYFIQMGSCIPEGLCVPEWISWGRLLIIHPLLILWALSVRNDKQLSSSF